MGVVELEPAAAFGAVVGAQGKVQQLVRKNEDQIVVVEPRGKGRIGNQSPGREDAHGRHAIVERDAHRGGKPGRWGSGTVSIRNALMMRARVARSGSGLRNAAHAAVTFRNRSNMARSAPSAPHFSTRSVSSVS